MDILEKGDRERAKLLQEEDVVPLIEGAGSYANFRFDNACRSVALELFVDRFIPVLVEGVGLVDLPLTVRQCADSLASLGTRVKSTEVRTKLVETFRQLRRDGRGSDEYAELQETIRKALDRIDPEALPLLDEDGIIPTVSEKSSIPPVEPEPTHLTLDGVERELDARLADIGGLRETLLRRLPAILESIADVPIHQIKGAAVRKVNVVIRITENLAPAARLIPHPGGEPAHGGETGAGPVVSQAAASERRQGATAEAGSHQASAVRDALARVRRLIAERLASYLGHLQNQESLGSYRDNAAAVSRVNQLAKLAKVRLLYKGRPVSLHCPPVPRTEGVFELRRVRETIYTGLFPPLTCQTTTRSHS